MRSEALALCPADLTHLEGRDFVKSAEPVVTWDIAQRRGTYSIFRESSGDCIWELWRLRSYACDLTSFETESRRQAVCHFDFEEMTK